MYDALPARLYYNAGQVPPAAHTRNTEQTQRDSSQEKPAVLVVDDHATIREVLAVILEDGGYRVCECADGGPALRQLRASREPMVVLLDMEMPGMDGFQVMQAVAADAALATRHAYVLVTANATTLPLAFVTLLSRLGVPIIPKPFDIDELMEAVAQAAARLGQRLA
ncbi:MAG TPA: response regulator [Ktedonobacterales bacterium]